MQRQGYIDVHSRIGVGRPEACRPPDVALREMDEAGIEISWICPADVCAAVSNREGNDYIAGLVAAHPDRFVGCAVTNPWFGEKAVEELHRAFGNGLKALFLHPPVQGFQLSDPLVDPLVEVAAEYKAPVYAPTGTPVCAEPLQLAMLARRHPQAKFIMGHMGYADFWYDGPSAAEVAGNIWLETSLIDCDTISDAAKKLGAERFVFGSAAPVSVVSVELEKVESLDLPRSAIDRIVRDNAKGILP